MSDVISQARSARTHLMQALSTLQLEDVPLSLQATAEGVAHVMSLLHRIETKGEGADTANRALTELRTVLNVLQAPGNEHPTGEAALEVVAGSLGMVHQLTHTLTTAPPGVAPAPNVTQPAAEHHVITQPIAEVSATATTAVDAFGASTASQQKPPLSSATTPVDPAFHAPTPAPQPPTARNGIGLAIDGNGSLATAPHGAADDNAHRGPMLPPEPQHGGDGASSGASHDAAHPTELRHTSSSQAIPLSRVSGPPSLPSDPPLAPPAPPSNVAAPPEVERSPSYNPEPQRISTNPISLPPLPGLPGETFVEAALGAYSTTNFFKGLSGNDVVDSGGLFIATYTPPEMGQNVRVHVSLPGGYEFQARGLVTWVREMPKTGSLNPLSPPGYGIKFTEISKEARQLVYRYVRNREPLFYDDV